MLGQEGRESPRQPRPASPCPQRPVLGLRTRSRAQALTASPSLPVLLDRPDGQGHRTVFSLPPTMSLKNAVPTPLSPPPPPTSDQL